MAAQITQSTTETLTKAPTLTGFICGDGQLVAWPAFSDLVFGKHADVVGGSGVELDDGGLIQLRGDVFGHLR